MLNLADVLAALTKQRSGMLESLETAFVANFVIDSREVARGDMFVAFKGERTDGHKFVGQALGRGALAVLVEDEIDLAVVQSANATVLDLRDGMLSDGKLGEGAWIIRVHNTERALQQVAAHWRKRFRGKVVGVTGSIGKTTTKEVVAQVLGVKHNVLKTEGNLNNAIGVPLMLLRLENTHNYAVLEMGMDRLGEITNYCEWAQPQVGVVTNVGPVHMEKLGSLENIALAKSELVLALPAEGMAILNNDDARVREMRKLSRARVMTYGLTNDADVWAEDVQSHGLDGISFTLHFGGARQALRVPMLGAHSAQTAVRAAAVGFADGFSMNDVSEGLMQPAEQLRLVVGKGPFDSLVIDDSYNASAESCIAALNVLNDLGMRPKIAVLGDMFELGAAEQQAHEEVGCRAALVADVLVCVGVRARWMAQSAVACGMDQSKVMQVDDKAQALDALKKLVSTRSAILVKGSRGMEMEEIVRGLEMGN